MQWFRDLLVLAGAAFIIWLAFRVRAILLPVFFGLIIAYVVNPVITWLNDRLHMPRLVVTSVVSGLIVVLFAGLVVLAGPAVADDLTELIRQRHQYLDRFQTQVDEAGAAVSGALGLDWRWVRQEVVEVADIVVEQEEAGEQSQPSPDESAATQPAAEEPARPSPGRRPRATAPADDWLQSRLLEWIGLAVEQVRAALVAVLYSFLAAFLALISFNYFAWRVPELGRHLDELIPPAHGDETRRILLKMERAFAGFFRGRLLQSAILAVELCFGWWLCGVPHWLVLGIVGGMLNMIPYAGSLAWLAALFFAAGDASGQTGIMLMFVWPTMVYFVGQGLDAYLVEPWVQSATTDLGPLTVIIAVVVGGALAGLLGVLLAIPVTACLKILFAEVVLPRYRRYIQRLGESSAST